MNQESKHKAKEISLAKIVMDSAMTETEYQNVYQWLDSKFEQTLGAMFFLKQTQTKDTPWQCLRLYDTQIQNKLLGVAVITRQGTCFWIPEESALASLFCPAIFNLQPRRIVTTAFGRDLLAKNLPQNQVKLVREYDQWIMTYKHEFSQVNGRMATLSDIPRLIEYQHLYNAERSVEENSDWELLIAQQKVAVYEVNGEIASIVRFGIETDRLVSIGGTYTFPSYRKQGLAEHVIKFAVNQIIATGRIAHLVVDQDNLPAIALYRKLGFKSVGTSFVGYLEYQTEVKSK